MIKHRIGGFDVPLAGWYIADITMHIVVARIPFLAHFLDYVGLIDQNTEGVLGCVHFLNVLKKFHFSDCRVDAVYSSCLLANFTRQQTLAHLKEINRTLCSDGIPRIAIDDVDYWIRT